MLPQVEPHNILFAVRRINVPLSVLGLSTTRMGYLTPHLGRQPATTAGWVIIFGLGSSRHAYVRLWICRSVSLRFCPSERSDFLQENTKIFRSVPSISQLYF